MAEVKTKNNVYREYIADILLTQFQRKKAEIQHSLKPEQAKRTSFALGLFDKSEQNKSTLRAFQENELFDENLAAKIVSFT